MADTEEPQPVSTSVLEMPVAAPEQEPVAQQQFYRQKSDAFDELKVSKMQRIKDFLTECQRVLIITKKPDKEELKTIVKISGLGMLVIGLVGFLIHLAKELLVK